MSALDDAPLLQPEDRAAWRAWLEANHATVRGVWLVMWRARARRTGLDYEAAIEEALCFGWVDGTAGRVDEERGKLYFAQRKPRSGWAAMNKARSERLACCICGRAWGIRVRPEFGFSPSRHGRASGASAA